MFCKYSYQLYRRQSWLKVFHRLFSIDLKYLIELYIFITGNYLTFPRFEYNRFEIDKVPSFWGEFDLPIGAPNPEWKGLLSRSRCPLALIMSPMTPPRPRQPPAFFFLLFDESFLFLVWMPSFFIVNGRFTWNSRRQQFGKFRIINSKSEFVARTNISHITHTILIRYNKEIEKPKYISAEI